MSEISSVLEKLRRTISSDDLKTVSGMARPEMESRVDDRKPGTPHSCRMEVLRPDTWSSSSPVQPYHRPRTTSSQPNTTPAPPPLVPSRDAFSSDAVQQQDNPLRDDAGIVQELVDRPVNHVSDNHSSSEDSPGEDDPRLEEQAVRRVAIQLRTIGDQMNAVMLQRNAAPRWQNWRGLYHGLVGFVADAINAVYQQALR